MSLIDWILAGAGVVCLVYEAYALYNPGDKHVTISERLRKYNKHSDSLVMLFLGWLFYHLFIA